MMVLRKLGFCIASLRDSACTGYLDHQWRFASADEAQRRDILGVSDGKSVNSWVLRAGGMIGKQKLRELHVSVNEIYPKF